MRTDAQDCDDHGGASGRDRVCAAAGPTASGRGGHAGAALDEGGHRAGAGAAHAAAAALLSYAEHTQGQALAHVRTLQVARADELLDLPPATHRNLELTQ
ncbi:MAG: hypothetical protein ACK4QW_13720, partial [Alphaproteobacteria bacterium]